MRFYTRRDEKKGLTLARTSGKGCGVPRPERCRRCSVIYLSPGLVSYFLPVGLDSTLLISLAKQTPPRY